MKPLMAPVSPGELVDKITILRVKAARIAPDQRANVLHELSLLEAVAEQGLSATLRLEIADLVQELTDVNAGLWDVEDGKRDCERRGDFGPHFVELARRVYRENDRRAAIKRAINLAAGSDILEEKSHTPY